MSESKFRAYKKCLSISSYYDVERDKMKTHRIIVLLFSISFLSTAYEWQAVMPTSILLSDIWFFNHMDGIGIGHDQVYRTSDGGNTWLPGQKLDIGSSYGDLQEVQFVDLENGFIRGGARLFRTNDGGDHWEETSVSLYNAFAMDFVNKDSGMVVSNGNIKVTHDGGETFHIQSYDSKDLFRDCQTVSPSLWYAGANQTLYKSTDAGLNWTQIDVNFGDSYRYLHGIHFRNEIEGLVYLGGNKVFKTIDGGSGWSALEIPTAMKNIQAFGPDTIYACNYRTLMWSYDGGESWESRTYDDFSHISAMHVVDSETMYVTYNWTRGLYRISNAFTDVKRLDDCTGGFLTAVSFKSPQVGMAVGSVGNMKKTINGGETWTPVMTSLSTVYGVSFPAEDTAYVWGTTAQGDRVIQKTLDVGETWETTPIPDNFYDIEFVDVSTMYARKHKGIAFSSDGGESWRDIALPNGAELVRNIKLLPDGDLLCSHDGGALSVLSNETDWELLWQDESLDGSKYYGSLGIADENNIFLGSNRSSLAYTRDGGTTWHDTMFLEGSSLLDISFATPKFGCIYAIPSIYWTYDGGISWHREDLSDREELFLLSQSTSTNNRIVSVDPFTIWIAGPNDALLRFQRSLDINPPQKKIATGHTFSLTAEVYHGPGDYELVASQDGIDWQVVGAASGNEHLEFQQCGPLNTAGEWTLMARSVVDTLFAATIELTVSTNQPPTVCLSSGDTVTVSQHYADTIDLKQCAIDDERDPITFSLTGPDWGKIDSSNQLVLHPEEADSSDGFTLSAVDSLGAERVVSFFVKVIPNGGPQICSQLFDTVAVEAGSEFTLALSDCITDDDGKVSFIIRGDEWARIASNDTIVFAPEEGDSSSLFTITARDRFNLATIVYIYVNVRHPAAIQHIGNKYSYAPPRVLGTRPGNPIVIRFQTIENSSVHIELLTLVGKRVYQKSIALKPGVSMYVIEGKNGLSGGNYCILVNDGRTRMKRIISLVR